MLAFFDYMTAIHKHMGHARGQLVGLFERGVILDRSGVKNRYVREIPRLQSASAYDSEVVSGEGGQPSNSFLERGRALISDVFAQ
jgi:hypothetical protein